MARSRTPPATVSPIAAARSSTGTVKVGWVAELGEGRLLVDFAGNPAGPLPSRTAVELPPAAVTERTEVALAFEDHALRHPIVIGVLRPAAVAGTATGSVVAEVDGRRLVIEGKDEVVLRCGDASITLRRNGRVVIRGAEVESRASGTNKVRGGSVRIN